MDRVKRMKKLNAHLIFGEFLKLCGCNILMKQTNFKLKKTAADATVFNIGIGMIGDFNFLF